MHTESELRSSIEKMFIAPVDYDSIKVETRETADEPILVVTLYKNNRVIFFQNYAFESTFLREVDTNGCPIAAMPRF
jgi:hypothetical protein